MPDYINATFIHVSQYTVHVAGQPCVCQVYLALIHSLLLPSLLIMRKGLVNRPHNGNSIGNAKKLFSIFWVVVLYGISIMCMVMMILMILFLHCDFSLLRNEMF